MNGSGRARRRVIPIACGLVLAIGAAEVAHAQQRQLFQWNGRVDQEIQLTINGRTLTTTNIGPSEPGSRGANVTSPLPRTDGEISVVVLNGRGQVDVLRQPTARNGYTAVIRVRDPQGGVGGYRLNVYWEPVAGGEVGPPFGRGRGYGRGYGNRVALMWSGDVDDNLDILLQPGGIGYRNLRGRPPRAVQSAVTRIPPGATELDIGQTEGRGQVFIVQQPTAENGYTARIRVRDPQAGYGHYAFTVTWR